MSSRAIGAIGSLAVASVALAFAWRTIFPFRDGIAGLLPEDTIAYAHINLTARVRREVEFLISPPKADPPLAEGLKFQIGERLAAVLTVTVRSRDVRELGLAWIASEPHRPYLAVLVGQRTSAQPDVVSAETISIGEREVRVLVVRVRGGIAAPDPSQGRGVVGLAMTDAKRMRPRQPVQAFLRPRLLPIPALDAARDVLPEILTASGTIGRSGFSVRSDGRRILLGPRRSVPLLMPPTVGSVQALRVPVREFLRAVAAPTHRELLTAIAAAMPDAADVVVGQTGVSVHFPNTDFESERTQDALRAVVARVWPTIQRRMLDGQPSVVAVADPSSVRIVPAGPNRYVIERTDDRVAFAAVIGDGFTIATDEPSLEAAAARTRPSLRIPRRCAQPSSGDEVSAIISLYPQFSIFFAMLRDGSAFRVCGGSPDI